jgi:hypothetical protein
MTSPLEWLLALPAFTLVACGFYYMIKFNRKRKGASFASQFLVAFLGPFVLHSTKILDEESKGYLRRFYWCFFLMAMYVGTLFALSGR